MLTKSVKFLKVQNVQGETELKGKTNLMHNIIEPAADPFIASSYSTTGLGDLEIQGTCIGCHVVSSKKI